ncbi:MAG: hypothetical protein IBJ09_03615 [Bacteroidia bacterium]|nr:hypothetical protein [Bacteroidia bacterium]
MKTFSKPAIGVIALLLLIIAALSFRLIEKEDSLFLTAIAQKSSEQPNLNSFNGLRFEELVDKKGNKITTKQINYRTAVICKKAYEKLMQNNILTDGKDPHKNPFEDKPLRGWRMDIASIKPLLDLYDQRPTQQQERRRKGGSIQNDQITEIFLVPIMRPEPDSTPSTKYVSLLIAGIKPNGKNGDIVFDKSNTRRVFFEYLKPCPDNCPDNIDSIFKDPAYTYPLH